MSEGAVYIYVLKDPDTGAVRYVGLTRNPHVRLYQHVNGLSVDPPQKKEWVATLAAAGKAPALEVVDVCAEADALAAEARWIECYRSQGADLLNGGLNHTGGRKPKASGQSKTKVTAYLSEADYEALQELAKRRETTHNAIIRTALQSERLLDDARQRGDKLLFEDTGGNVKEIVLR
jgi:predicted GIY-YIG superfamily endonuclease/predicted transcriptional regulator